jgi:hypothetical protein
MTAREWFEKNRERLSTIDRIAALCECAGATLKARSTICEAYDRVFGKRKSLRPVSVKAETPAGLSALADRFSQTSKARRKAGKMHGVVDAILSGELKKRCWIPDREMQIRSGISRDDWTNLRRDYEEMLAVVTDDDGRKMTIWIHPDSREEAMGLINQ